MILPVAGGTGLGSAAAASASGGQLSVIWVDADGCESVSQYCKYFLTTVIKNITDAVEDVVTKAASGHLPDRRFIGTLENNGVALAPYHDFDSKVAGRPEGPSSTSSRPTSSPARSRSRRPASRSELDAFETDRGTAFDDRRGSRR